MTVIENAQYRITQEYADWCSDKSIIPAFEVGELVTAYQRSQRQPELYIVFNDVDYQGIPSQFLNSNTLVDDDRCPLEWTYGKTS